MSETTPNNEDVTRTSQFSAISAASTEQVGVSRGLMSDDVAAINQLPLGSALLVVLNGPNTGARFLLNSDETIVGRHPSAAIFLDDVTVSRKHALFLRVDGDFYVRDAVSLNGTYVNRQLVEEAKLSSGDEVRIGKYQLTFYASPLAAL